MAYGLATSTEVAYYTYIYAKVDPRHFQKITSFTRVAILLGRFLSGSLAQALNPKFVWGTLKQTLIISQILTIFGGLDYRQLNFVSLSSVSAATVVAFALPPIEDTVYFHRPRELESAEDEPLQSGAASST